MHKTVEVKNFSEAEFCEILALLTGPNNLNEMWNIWKHLLTSVIDKHAPLRKKKRLKTNALAGLLMNCCVKCIKEIFLKRKLYLQLIP